ARDALRAREAVQRPAPRRDDGDRRRARRPGPTKAEEDSLTMSAQPPSPSPAPAAPKTNHIGLPKADYEGAKSTLCLGCGHDVITNQIINALYEMGQIGR